MTVEAAELLTTRVGIIYWGLPNPNGNPSALIPAPEGNTYALKHGAYSEAGLSERAAEVLAEIMALKHVVSFDLPAARELVRLTAMGREDRGSGAGERQSARDPGRDAPW